MTKAASAPTRILAQGRFETLSMLKNGEQLMVLLLFPLMGFLALAWTSFLDPYAQALDTDRLTLALAGVLALCVMSTALTGQGIATGFDRRYGVLKFMSTTPLGRLGLLAGKGIAVLTVISLQILLLIILALALGWHFTPLLMATLPTLLLGAAAFTSLGLLLAGILRAEATLALVNIAWVLLGAVGGSLLPADSLPQAVSWLPQLLPSGALGETLRATLSGQGTPLLPHLVLLAWTMLAGYGVLKYFKWTS